MRRTVTFIQCIQIWWRFALFLIGVLLLCSIFTQVTIWIMECLTVWLNLSSYTEAATNIGPLPFVGRVHSSLVHLVGISSILFFLYAQVSVFYLLLNHNSRIRDILYGKKANPYSAPVHKATYQLLD